MSEYDRLTGVKKLRVRGRKALRFCAKMKATGLIPKIVVADIHLDPSEINIRYVRADLIQEVAIMGNNDDRILEALKKILEPGN